MPGMPIFHFIRSIGIHREKPPTGTIPHRFLIPIRRRYPVVNRRISDADISYLNLFLGFDNNVYGTDQVETSSVVVHTTFRHVAGEE